MISDSRTIKSIYGVPVRLMSITRKVVYDRGTKGERVGYASYQVGVPQGVPSSHFIYKYGK